MVFSMNRVEDKCELALMGKVVEILPEEIEEAFKYIKKVVGYENSHNDIDILKDRINKYETKKVRYITTYRVYGMPCMCFLLGGASEDAFPEPFEEDYGTGFPCAFCYVFNFSDDMMCSEFGDVFFKKCGDGYYHVAS